MELHERGTTLVCLSLKKIIFPPWLSPPGKLLKLAFEKTVMKRDFRSRFGILMELGILLMTLTTLFTERMSATIAFFTLELVLCTSEQICCLFMPANQLGFPRVLQSDVVSSFIRFWCGLSLCCLMTAGLDKCDWKGVQTCARYFVFTCTQLNAFIPWSSHSELLWKISPGVFQTLKWYL